MNDALFVVNAGSSSIKFKLYGVVGDDIAIVLGGALDGIGSKPRLKARDHDDQLLVERTFQVADVSRPSQVQHVVADWLITQLEDHAIVGIGHRVVHGDPVYSQPILIDDRVLRVSPCAV